MSRFDRYKWPSIAKDLVQMSLLRDGEQLEPLDIANYHGITLEDLKFICQQPAFQSLVETEKSRAEKLGTRAEHVYRIEEMRGPLTEKLFKRLMDDDTLKLDEFVRGYVALIKSAEPLIPEEKAPFAVNTGVNVQINVPVLDNPKLAHLQTPTPLENLD
jgi:hypothetical protein